MNVNLIYAGVALALLAMLWLKRDALKARWQAWRTGHPKEAAGAAAVEAALERIWTSKIKPGLQDMETSIKTRLNTAIVMREQAPPSLAAAASNAATDPPPPVDSPPAPAGAAAPAASTPAAPSAAAETPPKQPTPETKGAPVLTTSQIFNRQPNVPLAIRVLQHFKEYAHLLDLFIACPNNLAKYVIAKENEIFRALDHELGITANWINACEAYGVLGGVGVDYAYFDVASGQLVINRIPTGAISADNPSNAWSTTDGKAPPFYIAPTKVDKAGKDLLVAFMRQFLTSQRLRSMGLTHEAIAAAAA